MSKRDYYEILGVIRTANDEDLKKAYRRLAIQHHPDRNPGDKASEEKFKEINEAYQILSDARKRQTYDQFGHAGLGGMPGGGFEQGVGSSFSDIFDNIFGDIFGGGGATSAGVDLRYNMEITFEEAAFGVEKQIHFEKESTCETCQGSGARAGTRPQTCKTCRGAGQIRFNQGFFTLSRPCSTCMGRGVVIEERCETCRGRGKTRKPHAVNVKIPAGVDSEQRLRLKGEGEIAEPGGRPGDLFVHLRVKEHSLFRREDEHVIVEVPITFVQAAIGAEIDVPTLMGSTTMKISSGTQSGTVSRLKGKGIKRLNGSGFGDQLVKIVVETPTSLNARQKELLREFEREAALDSHPGILMFVQKFKEIFKT
jgi:molecular chaperone DnaJ